MVSALTLTCQGSNEQEVNQMSSSRAINHRKRKMWGFMASEIVINSEVGIDLG